MFNYTLKIPRQGTLIAKLEGDLCSSPEVQRFVNAVCESCAGTRFDLVLDFGELRWIDSYGLGLLVLLRSKVVRQGGEIYIVQPNERINNLMVTTKLDTLLTICENMDAVRRKMRGGLEPAAPAAAPAPAEPQAPTSTA